MFSTTIYPHLAWSNFITKAKAWAQIYFAIFRGCVWNRKDKLYFKLRKTALQFAFGPSLLPPVAHQQLRNDFNRDGGEGNESQPQSKHFTSLNTCFGLLVPWEKMHWGCTLAHKCPVCLVHSPQTTIAKCLCGHEAAWVGSFKNLEICLSYLSGFRWPSTKCCKGSAHYLSQFYEYLNKCHDHLNLKIEYDTQQISFLGIFIGQKRHNIGEWPVYEGQINASYLITLPASTPDKKPSYQTVYEPHVQY